MNGRYQASEGRDNSPAQKDSRNPDASTDPVQQQIARGLKNEVADKENPVQQSELLARDVQLLVHCQRCKPNVIPIENGDNKEQQHKRQNPEPQLLNGPRLNRGGCYVGAAIHWRPGSAKPDYPRCSLRLPCRSTR